MLSCIINISKRKHYRIGSKTKAKSWDEGFISLDYRVKKNKKLWDDHNEQEQTYWKSGCCTVVELINRKERKLV